MKKLLISFILILMVISTVSFAAYPAELENAELEMIEATDLGEMEETEIEPKVLEDAEVTTIEPRNSIGSDEIISDDVYKMEDEIKDEEQGRLGPQSHQQRRSSPPFPFPSLMAPCFAFSTMLYLPSLLVTIS